MDCLYLIFGLGFDVGGLTPSLVPLWYPCCLCCLWETGSLSVFLGASFDLFVTIIYRLNFSPRIPLTKVSFLVIIEGLIFCRKAMKIWCCMKFLLGRGKLSPVVHLPYRNVLGNYCSNIYPYFYLLALFSYIYYTYVERIYTVQNLQIRKFQHQVRMALCDRLVEIHIYQIQPGSCIGQAKHVGRH